MAVRELNPTTSASPHATIAANELIRVVNAPIIILRLQIMTAMAYRAALTIANAKFALDIPGVQGNSFRNGVVVWDIPQVSFRITMLPGKSTCHCTHRR